MNMHRILLLLPIVVIALYFVTSPATASEGAADFGNWLLEGFEDATDAIIGFIGGLL